MPIVVSSSVDKVMLNKKCDLTAKFYVMKATSADSIEEKLHSLNCALTHVSSDDIYLDILRQRVEIYGDLKLHNECQQNQQWISEIQHTSPIKKSCQSKLQNDFGSNFEEKCHSTLPNVLKSLELSPNNKLRTKKSLKAGQLLAKEEPFCGVLLESALFRRCRNCLKCNNLNLIPCIKCQLAMFCSTDCLQAAKFHHLYECGATQVAKVPFNFGGIQVALRSIFELLAYFDGLVDDMRSFVDDCKKNSKTIFQIDASQPQILEKYAAMISLPRFFPVDCYDELLKTIKVVLEIYPVINELFVTVEQKEFLVDFIVMQSTLDYIVHYDYELQSPTALSVNFLYNAMDHSCASNVHAIFNDGSLYYFAKYPVNRHESLTYNHILNFEISAYDVRNLTAKKCYDFECKCQACINNYPMLYSMKIHNDEILRGAMYQKEDIPKLKRKKLRSLFKENCKYINEHYPADFPSQEIYILHLCNCLILSRFISH